MMLPGDDDEDEGEDEREDEAPPKSAEPASEKQLSFIRVLQDKMALADDKLADVLQEVAGTSDLATLGRREASEVIDELQTRARQEGIDLDAQPKASDKQVGFMRSLKRRAHLTDEEFAAFLEEHAGVTEPEEVGKRDASKIIDALLKKAESGGAKGAPAKPAAGGAKKAAPKKADKPAAKKAKPAPPPDDDDDRPPDEDGPPPDADDDVPF